MGIECMTKYRQHGSGFLACFSHMLVVNSPGALDCIYLLEVVLGIRSSESPSG